MLNLGMLERQCQAAGRDSGGHNFTQRGYGMLPDFESSPEGSKAKWINRSRVLQEKGNTNVRAHLTWPMDNME